MTAPTFQVQTWSETLRLPHLTVPAEYEHIIALTDSYRRPAIPFQSKHLPTLKRNLCFVLQRPVDKSRTGIIYVWPERRCCLYMSADVRPRVALLRLRIDEQFYAAGVGPTVLSATLSPSLRTLQIEDVLQWKGDDLFNTMMFSERWRLALQWRMYLCEADEHLLGGLRMTLANWGSLASMTENGVWNIQADTAGLRRLLWFARKIPEKPVASASAPAPAPAPAEREPTSTKRALATRGGGPDQWILTTSGDVSIGRALIRGIDISKQLREASTNSVPVDVKWNETFQKWEVIKIIQ